jgi:uncharacterized paraquat-inducible protein A
MPEVRPIDANAAADKIMHEVEVHADEIRIGAVTIMIAFARALRDETDFPTIEPEVRHGRWAKADDKQYCTNCRAVTKVRNASFCWHCGAQMDLRTPTEAALDMADSAMMGGADNA